MPNSYAWIPLVPPFLLYLNWFQWGLHPQYSLQLLSSRSLMNKFIVWANGQISVLVWLDFLAAVDVDDHLLLVGILSLLRGHCTHDFLPLLVSFPISLYWNAQSFILGLLFSLSTHSRWSSVLNIIYLFTWDFQIYSSSQNVLLNNWPFLNICLLTSLCGSWSNRLLACNLSQIEFQDAFFHCHCFSAPPPLPQPHFYLQSSPSLCGTSFFQSLRPKVM